MFIWSKRGYRSYPLFLPKETPELYLGRLLRRQAKLTPGLGKGGGRKAKTRLRVSRLSIKTVIHIIASLYCLHLLPLCFFLEWFILDALGWEKRNKISFECFLFKSEESTSHSHLGMSSSLLSPYLKFYHLRSTFNQDLVSPAWMLSPLLQCWTCIKTQPMLSFVIKKLLCALILAFKLQPFLWQKMFTSSIYFRTWLWGCGR